MRQGHPLQILCVCCGASFVPAAGAAAPHLAAGGRITLAVDTIPQEVVSHPCAALPMWAARKWGGKKKNKKVANGERRENPRERRRARVCQLLCGFPVYAPFTHTPHQQTHSSERTHSFRSTKKKMGAAGHSINVLIREAAIGSGLGLAGALVWLFTVTMPVNSKMLAWTPKK